MLYYRLLKKDIKEAERVVSGQVKMVAELNTVIPRVCAVNSMYLGMNCDITGM